MLDFHSPTPDSIPADLKDDAACDGQQMVSSFSKAVFSTHALAGHERQALVLNGLVAEQILDALTYAMELHRQAVRPGWEWKHQTMGGAHDPGR